MATHYGIIADFLISKNDPALFDVVSTQPGIAGRAACADGGTPLEQRHAQPAPGELVRGRHPDRAAADDDHVRLHG